MIIQNNISLKPFNTFGMDVNAKRFVEVQNEEEMVKVLEENDSQDLFFLGGGSNMLLTKDIDQLVVKVNIQGINASADGDEDIVEVGAGVVWHDFVLWAIEHNLGGIENLSLIPGNVGTSPIQNIGAYGVEIKDTMVDLTAFELSTGTQRIFTNQECRFGYRDSVFKNELKGKFVITKVRFRLSNKNHHLKTEYGAIKNQLKENKITAPSIADVSNAVIQIRQSKLPDPKEIGNSGSFFKNPVIPRTQFEELKSRFPDIAAYPNGDQMKLAAGWLIEKAGWKGFREGDFGVHTKQALVLVNYGGAVGKDIQMLSSKIQASIKETFGITLEAEVNIL